MGTQMIRPGAAAESPFFAICLYNRGLNAFRAFQLKDVVALIEEEHPSFLHRKPNDSPPTGTRAVSAEVFAQERPALFSLAGRPVTCSSASALPALAVCCFSGPRTLTGACPGWAIEAGKCKHCWPGAALAKAFASQLRASAWCRPVSSHQSQAWAATLSFGKATFFKKGDCAAGPDAKVRSSGSHRRPRRRWCWLVKSGQGRCVLFRSEAWRVVGIEVRAARSQCNH